MLSHDQKSTKGMYPIEIVYLLQIKHALYAHFATRNDRIKSLYELRHPTLAKIHYFAIILECSAMTDTLQEYEICQTPPSLR